MGNSSKMTQKEAVFQAVVNVCGKHETYNPTKEQRAQINTILFEGFRSGNIQIDREYSDTDLKSYVSGLQSNWLRKDKRLNGGVAYTAKNPGSRAGSGDASLKAMRALMTTLTSESDKAEVQKHIDARVAEIQASKAKKVSVDFSALPADLAAKFAK
jgi:hypothetical protein